MQEILAPAFLSYGFEIRRQISILQLENYWLSERSEAILRFGEIRRNFFFRQMSGCQDVYQFRYRGHSFQAILMKHDF